MGVNCRKQSEKNMWRNEMCFSKMAVAVLFVTTSFKNEETALNVQRYSI